MGVVCKGFDKQQINVTLGTDLFFMANGYIFATLNGLVAEWLGTGLQNLVQRFESARDLNPDERLLQWLRQPLFSPDAYIGPRIKQINTDLRGLFS